MKNKASTCLHAAACALAALSGAPAMADKGFTLSSGINYSTGDYGTGSTTKITSIPVIGQYETGPWKLKLTVPWIQVEGSANVVPGTGPITTLNPAGRTRGGGTAVPGSTTSGTDEGLGDIVAAATYNALYDTATRFGLDVTGKVKFGTADEAKGLGTGKNDYTVAVDVYKGIGAYTVFGTLGYTVMGDSGIAPLNDVFSASVGGLYKLSERTSTGLSLDTRERVSASSAAQRELTAFVSHKLTGNWKAQGYLLKGFSDGSPDWGAGVTVGLGF